MSIPASVAFLVLPLIVVVLVDASCVPRFPIVFGGHEHLFAKDIVNSSSMPFDV